MFSKAINVGLIALAFSPLIRIWIFGGGGIAEKAGATQRAYTGIGLDGTFDINRLKEGWLPAGTAVAIGFLKKFLMKRFPVR